MEADQPRRLAFVEVAADGVPNVGVELLEILRFGEDGLAQRPCGVSTFGGLFDQEDQLVEGRLLWALGGWLVAHRIEYSPSGRSVAA